MLRDRGLDPTEWYIDSIRPNAWEGPTKTGKQWLYQTRFTAKRRDSFFGLFPARSDGWKPAKRIRTTLDVLDQSRRVVICGDHQAPFHDKKLHDLFCQWLNDNAPDQGIVLGDLGDYPNISRHKRDPENIAHANECIQSSYEIWRDYIDASPNTEWQYLIGNHENRLRDYILAHAPEIHDLRQASTATNEGAAVHGMVHLLRLDELGVEFVDPQGSYENAYVVLSNNLAVYHGWKAQQGSGVTALNTLKQTGFSVLIGHTHRQSQVNHTYHEIPGSGKVRQLMASEIGSMCRLDGKPDASGRRFPNYTSLPDWQNGFATADIWPDGKFNVDLAKYVNGTLLYRSDRYE